MPSAPKPPPSRRDARSARGAFFPTDVVRIHERNLRVLRPGEQRLVQGAGREELLHTGFCVSRKEMLCSNRNDLQVLDGADRLLFLPTGVV